MTDSAVKTREAPAPEADALSLRLDALTVASTTTSTPKSAALRTHVESSASGPLGKR